MSVAEETGEEAAPAAAARSSRPASWRLLANNRLAALGLVLLSLVVLVALAAPLLPLAPPDATAPAERLQRPLAEGHLLGTDHLGRDILSRLVWGTRISLAVGISASLIAAFFGSLIGLVAGYAGGRTDHLMMRGIDMLMAFPYILLALAIVAVLGPGLLNALYAIAVVNIPFFARNIRGITLGLARRDFVEAAKLSGKGPIRVVATEIFPNVLPTIVIALSTTVGWMILETAGLSFLGLGAQPPQADLGSMLGEGRKLLFTAPYVSIIPGVMIFIIVMSINLLGDGIRDVLDPRLRSGALAHPSARTQVKRRNVPEMPAEQDGALDVVGLQTEFSIGRDVFRAVGGVDLRLGKEECLGLVGESGSGKSVTALSIASLVPSPPGAIVGGRVMREGRDVLEMRDGELRRLRGGEISMIFQDPLSSLHPLFTVGDQIAEAVRAHQPLSRAEAWAKAVDLLGAVQIPNPKERAKSYPHELSGGMRQRVAIAIALVNEPEVLIADEPTTALDVTVQAQVLKLLDDLRHEKHTAVLFITHDFGVVSEICERVAVMYAGRIVEMGRTEEVLDAPAHPYTRKLIDCVPLLDDPDRRLDAIEGLPPPLNRLPEGCAFAPRCPRAQPDCRARDIPLAEVAPGRMARCLYPLVDDADASADAPADAHAEAGQ
ncbi:dipeptide/oligopeptide/nickel ABC transporter permease/ATP-binding protein [Afifella sp. H1R]|uniref:dipeptide/oligopeptide/nickel ABC transporter permease/ATP-binding protein n=1 Tax=Afifella sp. H1R TaxID=2908841 RepID=UPI001F2E0AD2|nr:dipeptide/oligopeptide/nickel ABC transporter permease/ATP-binding protein [Afifella sp. H1R]MCF1504700.1 dipeptide/oligopeptide/nickel ABC transporter permease/ATP-binding protein [Afifella sp. H1R]